MNVVDRKNAVKDQTEKRQCGWYRNDEHARNKHIIVDGAIMRRDRPDPPLSLVPADLCNTFDGAPLAGEAVFVRAVDVTVPNHRGAVEGHSAAIGRFVAHHANDRHRIGAVFSRLLGDAIFDHAVN